MCVRVCVSVECEAEGWRLEWIAKLSFYSSGEMKKKKRKRRMRMRRKDGMVQEKKEKKRKRCAILILAMEAAQ